MRVLHVAACYPPTWAYGGIPRAVHALVRAQRARGIQARVWTTDAFDATRRAPVPPLHLLDGVPVRVARNLSNRLAWRHQLYVPLGAAPDLSDVDLVHLHGHRHLLNGRAWRAARARGLPVVLTGHGTVPALERKTVLKRVWDPLVDGDVPRRADAVIACSRAEVRQLLACGVAADRIERIPNGMWMPEFSELPPRGTARARWGLGHGPLVVYLGQITPRKRVDALVEAFRAPSGVTLALAGPVRGMSLPDGVRALGVLEGPERLALLVDADVLVYPSSDEVFGLVPLEGLLCGVPVVVGDDCGCGEIVAEAGAGVLVDGSPARIRQAVEGLLADPARASACVARGRAWIAAHLDAGVVADAHMRLYRRLLERS
ncbi:MAG: hypothetical protein RLZZ299_244 [Pseudomonadota bacterium]